MSFIQSRNLIEDGLLLRLRFDENGGTVAEDWSGNGNDGTINGSPTWTTDAIDGIYALDFDGVDDYVSGFGSIIPPGSPHTILGFVKITDTTQTGQALWGQGDWHMGMWYNESGNQDIRYHVADTSTTLIYGTYAWTGDTARHQIGGRWDGGTTVEIIFDGQVVATGTSTASSRGPMDNFEVGRYEGGPNRYADVIIDDLRVYNRVLTNAEIQRIANGNG